MVPFFLEREKRAGEYREQLVDRPSRPTGERVGRRSILEGRQPRGDDVVEDGDDEERPSKRALGKTLEGALLLLRPGNRYRRDGRRRKTTVEFGRRAEKSTDDNDDDDDDDDDDATRSVTKTNVDGDVERETPDRGERTRRRTRVEEFVFVLRRAKLIHEMVTYAPEPSRTSAAAVLENNNDGSNSNLERRVIVIVMRVVITIKATVERIAQMRQAAATELQRRRQEQHQQKRWNLRR